MKSHRTAAALLAAGITAFAAQGAGGSEEPGTAPNVNGTVSGVETMDTDITVSASGLKVFYNRFGKFRLSVDAAGSNDEFHRVEVEKPADDAVVVKAFLMAASNWNEPIAKGDIRLGGMPVTWMTASYNDLPPSYLKFFHNVLADVTDIVKPKLDAMATAGTTSFKVVEVNNNVSIDGEILAVVFKVPSATEQHNITLMFGAQQPSGDRFEITLAEPIDPDSSGALADMGLGISYSYQASRDQYSLINVTGARLPPSAGGEDDGGSYRGGVITVGGLGDTRDNPVNPYATPSDPRTDDERYSLLPFIDKTATSIKVDTINPSNDDNIFFAWFELSGEGEINKDTDGDGLLDSWETEGYDHDGDGVVDVPIHLRGADPLKKDVFVAYAWMEASPTETRSHRPTTKILNAVIEAFARAPVTNPDGSTGINLHFRNRGPVPHDDDLNPAWDEFDAIMNPLVFKSARRIYHRMLNAHAYNDSSANSLSRGIPASDFIESFGRWGSNPGTFRQRAGTIMHALGHNLGLRHGGVDHENCKPNHLSIMNNAYKTHWLLRDGMPYLDYERFDLWNLDEANLNEAAGLNLMGDDILLKPYGVRWYVDGQTLIKRKNAHSHVDWNNNGIKSDSGVSVDINCKPGLGILRARYPEWDNLMFDGGNIGASMESMKANMVTSPGDLEELTYEQYLQMQENVIEVE